MGANSNLVQGDALSVLSIDVLDAVGQRIGAIASISPNFARPNSRVRELNSDAGGDVKDMVPGVETITISVTGFALRSTKGSQRNIINRLPQSTPTDLYTTQMDAAAFLSLKDNRTPFSIKEKQTNPKTGAVYIKSYNGCLLNSFSYTIGITGDVVISESAAIDVSSITDEE